MYDVHTIINRKKTAAVKTKGVAGRHLHILFSGSSLVFERTGSERAKGLMVRRRPFVEKYENRARRCGKDEKNEKQK